jgi:hypothetical protein
VRELPEDPQVGPWTVENRDGDDWMVVDCGGLVVNVMDAETREVLDLERMYEGIARGEPRPAWAERAARAARSGGDDVDAEAEEDRAFEEWLAANPLPDKWVRLERDEEAIRAAVKRK